MSSNVLIRIHNVTKEYADKKRTIKALKGISLDIHRGEIIGLLGVNGAGKTTLSSILATRHPATSGSILFEEKSIYADIANYRRIIGYCPQKPNLDPALTIEQNLVFAGRYYGMTEDAIQIRKNELMKKYELKQYADSSSSILSGGYKQRAMIARALMHNPLLVILDEPTVGLDPHIRHQLWESIRDLKNEGVSVILTTHYLDEAEVLSDRICVLDKGNIKLIDTPENLKSVYQKSNLEEVFLQLMHEETR
ncbi:ABC transporter ATP-binding protein [bacterium]|nr:MAG: ABC transporter ATP-binding protein [bacterium]